MAEKVTDLNWMKKLLSEEEVAHLALSDNGSPYVVPINYAYMDDMLVLHCAMTGRKLDIIHENPSCCLAVNRHPDKVKYHPEKKCHYRFQSVLVYGKARFVEWAEERLKWIRKYNAYFNNRLDWIMPGQYDIKSAEKCGIILVEIESMTGRREEGHDKNAHKAIDKPVS